MQHLLNDNIKISGKIFCFDKVENRKNLRLKIFRLGKLKKILKNIQ